MSLPLSMCMMMIIIIVMRRCRTDHIYLLQSGVSCDEVDEFRGLIAMVLPMA